MKSFNPATAATGASITITGTNFSGMPATISVNIYNLPKVSLKMKNPPSRTRICALEAAKIGIYPRPLN
ncbi:MAG: IPT/TIG domain-containing protein [Candidatus Riflebacteria bacterium]|nr:IPT/TIG domain-containing protein [Candidatus Riflebacteria bacterium]